MNFSKFLASSLFILSFSLSADNYGVYYKELKALKKNPATKQLFDKDAHPVLSEIQRDIEIFKNLSYFPRLLRSFCFIFDVIIVTPQTLPKLYEYVETVCQKADMPVPTIFVTRKDGFFNAFAQKFFMSTGSIVIGKKLMHDLSDDALEGVIAHEIGHIKHNHINKGLALHALVLMCHKGISRLLEIDRVTIWSSDSAEQRFLKMSKSFAKQYLLYINLQLLCSLIMNKLFEKEADEFACKENGKSKGLIEFFEFILEKERLREEEFVTIYELLQKNKADVGFMNYYCNLIIRYYIAKLGHLYGKAYKYIYHNTFLGAHPSPEARIEAAKRYL